MVSARRCDGIYIGRSVLTLEVVGVRNEVRARPWATAAAERRAGPVTAKCRVEDNLVVSKVLAEIAAVVAREDRGRRTPGCGIGVAVREILRDLGAREEPDRDTRRVPEMREHAARVGIKSVTERIVAGLAICAACVGARGTRAGSTDNVRGRRFSAGQRAGGTSVERNLILGVEVHALYAAHKYKNANEL